MAVKTYITLLAGVTPTVAGLHTHTHTQELWRTSQLPRLSVLLHKIIFSCHVMFIQSKWVFSGVVKSVI